MSAVVILNKLGSIGIQVWFVFWMDRMVKSWSELCDWNFFSADTQSTDMSECR